MLIQPPLDVIFSKWAELIGYVEVLENSRKPGQRHDALTSALELVCRDLSKFIDDRYAQLHLVAASSLPKTVKKRRKSQARSEQYVVAGRRACLRLGRALDQAKARRWRAEVVMRPTS